MICAGELTQDGVIIKNICDGDSGGPLTVKLLDRTVVYGVVSFGDEKCKEHWYPGVFARVGKFIPWIKKRMKSK